MQTFIHFSAGNSGIFDYRVLPRSSWEVIKDTVYALYCFLKYEKFSIPKAIRPKGFREGFSDLW